MSERIEIGVWTEWPSRTGWKNEGMTRLLSFLIEGASLDKRVSFRILVSRAIYSEARADLNTINAVEGLDYHVHAPEDDQCAENDIADVEGCLKVAEQFPNIKGWVALYPYFDNALRLPGPVAAIFPDSIPNEFPSFGYDAWVDTGAHFIWASRVARLVTGASKVIVFSGHVARFHANALFKVPINKIVVIPHAPPDLISLAPFVVDRKRSENSRIAAAEILRAHARERKWAYLIDFPFEETSYVVVSTQDRPTKNIILVAQALRHLVRNEHLNLKVFTTSELLPGSSWTLAPHFVRDNQLEVDFFSMPQLPREVHAALYHGAAAVVHPSFFEGGQGPFPFYEAVSIGTPCLMADGPHTKELLMSTPELLPWIFDPNDDKKLAELIEATISYRDESLDVQQKCLSKLLEKNWRDVAILYCEAALGEKLPAPFEQKTWSPSDSLFVRFNSFRGKISAIVRKWIGTLWRRS